MFTLGEERVRVAFNPSADSDVDRLKQKAAELIDMCEKFKSGEPRLVALAQTAFEEGCMWAVKAATGAPNAK